MYGAPNSHLKNYHITKHHTQPQTQEDPIKLGRSFKKNSLPLILWGLVTFKVVCWHFVSD